MDVKKIIDEYGHSDMMVLGLNGNGYDYVMFAEMGSLKGKYIAVEGWDNAELHKDGVKYRVPFNSILPVADKFTVEEEDDSVILHFKETVDESA